MAKKIIYKKNELLGSSAYRSSAMRDIKEKDEKRVLNQGQERKQLFGKLKKYRDGGVTEGELKSVLANLKYDSDNYFTKKEVNDLAQELGLGSIGKKHLPKKSLSHTSQLDRAQHDVNFSKRKGVIREKCVRKLPNDDIRHYTASKFVKELLRKKTQKNMVSGDMIFDREEEDALFRDVQTGRRFSAHTSQLRRPKMYIKSQSSFRGRGLIGGGKNI